MRIVGKTGLGVQKLYNDINLPSASIKCHIWEFILACATKPLHHIHCIPRYYLCSGIKVFYILGILNITSNALPLARTTLWATRVFKNIGNVRSQLGKFSPESL